MYKELEDDLFEKMFNLREEHLLEKANSGNADAMYLLAKLYYAEAQNEDAFPWFCKAAEAGNADAICYMGIFENNKEKALTYYLKAIEMGSAMAMSALGQKYLQGLFPVEKDEEKAFDLFKKAAELGNSEGYYWLAMCYRDGSGVEKDFEKAFNYAIKAYNAIY